MLFVLKENPMKRILGGFVFFSLIALLVRVATLPLGATGVDFVNSCVTPVPGGTIIIPTPYTLNFSATKSLTATTVYTIQNLESRSALVTQKFLRYPDCSNATTTQVDTLPGAGIKRYSLDDFGGLPHDFFGKIHITSARRITGTSKILSKLAPSPTATPTLIATAMPTVITTPDEPRVFMPFVTNNR